MFPFLLPPARRIVDGAASLAERAQHATEWPITPVDEEFDVQLTGYDSGSSFYAYKEQDYDTNANYYDKAPGRVGTVAGIAGELVTFRPAKTFNGEVISGLPKYARVRRRTKSTGYDAIYEIINPPPGTIGAPLAFSVVFFNAGGSTGVPLGTMSLTSVGTYQFWGEIGSNNGSGGALITRPYLQVDVTAGTAALWGGSGQSWGAGTTTAYFKGPKGVTMSYTLTPVWWAIVTVAPATLNLTYWPTTSGALETAEADSKLYYARIA